MKILREEDLPLWLLKMRIADTAYQFGLNSNKSPHFIALKSMAR